MREFPIETRCVQGLCFAFITSQDVSIKAKDVKFLARCSKGMPGLLARCLALAGDPLYRNSLLRLEQNDSRPSDSLWNSLFQPSHFVQQIQRACWDTAAATETKPVLALISACRTHTHAIPLPLAASIAHKDCSMLSGSAISSTQVGFTLGLSSSWSHCVHSSNLDWTCRGPM